MKTSVLVGALGLAALAWAAPAAADFSLDAREGRDFFERWLPRP